MRKDRRDQSTRPAQPPSAVRAARVLLACILCILSVPVAAKNEPSDRSVTLPACSTSTNSETLPAGTKLSRLDGGLLAGGAGLTAWGVCGLSPKKRDVPGEGLNSGDIHLELDRNSIRWRTHQPIDVGNSLLYGALVHPSILGIASARENERWSACVQALTYQVEALLLAGGTSLVLKKTISRPRPYTYLPVHERSEHGANGATSDQAFESFPSGHATTAWASSTVAVSSLALRRADLSPTVHFLNGLLAGGLAMSTSLLRVEAGMHFPTDIAMGAMLGATAGTLVPLAHQGFGNDPRQAQSLKWGWLGIGGGCMIALLLTPPTSPWVD